MKTVVLKSLKVGPSDVASADDGVRVYVDGVNVLGCDADWMSSFRNCDYESTDGYAVMALLKHLETHGVLRLECDEGVKEVFARTVNDIPFKPVERPA